MKILKKIMIGVSILLILASVIFVIYKMVMSIPSVAYPNENAYIGDINDAILENDVEKVKKLIKNVNLNHIFDEGNFYGYCNAEEEDFRECYTPLQVAYITNNYEVTKLLLENGADVNYGNDSTYPLDHIITKYYGEDNIFNEDTYKIAELLIENGASVTADDGTSAGTPIEKLCERFFETDKEKETSLKMFKLLEANGAQLTSDEYLKPLIDLAKWSKNEYIVKYLQEKGA